MKKEEKTPLVLQKNDIDKILLSHYIFENTTLNKEYIFRTLTMNYKMEEEKRFGSTITNIKFIIKYQDKIESLDQVIEKEIVVNLQDLINILNEKLSNDGYVIDSLEKHIGSDFLGDAKKLKSITFYLNKKEKVKTKMKGCRDYV